MKGLLVATVMVLSLATVALAAPGPGGGQVREVSIPGKFFAPSSVDVLVGDTVVWRNGDSSSHTVTAADDSFDSGYLSPGATFTLTFSKPGLYAYHCTIHRFMRGAVRVAPVALSAPEAPIVSGGRVVLNGLAPAGTAKVVVRRSGSSARDQTVVPAADGSFSVAERAIRPVTYRAFVGNLASPLVRIEVAPKVAVQPSAGSLVAVAVPSRAGVHAVLQAYDREHFAWRTVARGVVRSDSHVSIPLPAERRGRFRIVVRGGEGWADGASPAVVVR